jgi:alpha-glucosidase
VEKIITQEKLPKSSSPTSEFNKNKKNKKPNENEQWIWWKHGIIYHIYVRSFLDSNADGIGDLQGIIKKLDYLTGLGIHAIWLSPINDSPNIDFGYDVRDYRKINPEYGTLHDFKLLIYQAHKRNIHVIMDLIMNHTSVKHPWFIESASSKLNPKRDWYIWKDPKNGKVPNNWKSAFSGSGWEWHKPTGQYYFHSFLKEQADLNWRCPEMQNAFFEEIRFWLEFGVDGFRLDVINFIVKDKKFRNNPSLLRRLMGHFTRFTRNRPASYKIVKKLRSLLDSYPNKMAVGEIYATPPGNPKLAASYLGDGDNALHLAFNFALFFRHWNASSYFKAINKWMKYIPKKGWPCFVFSNHDLNRSINRIGTGLYKIEKAKVLATLLLTIKGTPFVYYGEEIGMPNIKVDRSQIKDPVGKKFWPFYSGRDGSRSPMRWNNYLFGGFSQTQPWLPVGSEIETINVKSQKNDQHSIYNVYKTLIKVRNQHKALQMGSWKPIIKGKSGILAYYRIHENEQILIILNFSGRARTVKFSIGPSKILFSTHQIQEQNNRFDRLILKAFEAIVLKIEK